MSARAIRETYDFVVIGSGFGGSVSAMRLAEKGYRVLVLERGKRFRDSDFARTNWLFWKYLWLPALRCFGILQISPFRDVFVLHGSGVGGGSLGYGNVLMEPDPARFEAPAWKRLADWQSLLAPYYVVARRMLGATPNPRRWPADDVLHAIACEAGLQRTFRPTEVSVFFGQAGREGQEVPDPYFGGEGPARRGCNHCGGCLVGCRYNAKNTLDKNYLYFAEKWGAAVQAECEVIDLRPLPPGQADGARYEVIYRRSTALLLKPQRRVRARNVVLSAGSLGTLKLLFRCREITRSLPKLSPRLGELVRTNGEALMGVTARDLETDYSRGNAITSVVMADSVTAIEPVRYPAGSSLIRLLASPLVEKGRGVLPRLAQMLLQVARRPLDFLKVYLLPGWAVRTTILLVMQSEDSRIRFRLGRDLFTLFRRQLVSELPQGESIASSQEVSHRVTRAFARRTNGIPLGSINEGLLSTPITAHILGGCPFGRDDREGVVGLDCQVHNYAGLYVVDGSIVPANPGINPSLTIAALAEYAMSLIPPREGAPPRQPLGFSTPPHHQQPAPPAPDPA